MKIAVKMFYPYHGKKGGSDRKSYPPKKEQKLLLKTIKASHLKSYQEAREKLSGFPINLVASESKPKFLFIWGRGGGRAVGECVTRWYVIS